MRLEGATTFSGANFYEFDDSSVPLIRQNGDLTITEDTTLDIPSGVFDWVGGDGSTLTTIEPGTIFTINANAIDTFAGSYDGETNVGEGSQLVVNTFATWENDGEINLDQATLEGSGVVNTGLIQGNGKVSPSGLDNQGSIQASGGGLLAIGPNQGETGGLIGILPTDGIDALENGVINYGFDLNGSDEDGSLWALNGDLRIDAFEGMFVFDGTLNIGFGNEYLMNTGGLYNRGTIGMTGISQCRADLVQDGNLLAVSLGAGNATIVSDNIRFGSSGTNTLNGGLHIQGNAWIEFGALFDGNSSLVNMSDLVLTLVHRASVDVTVENPGRLELGTSTAAAGMAVFENSDTGTLAIDLVSDGGLRGFDFDQLIVLGIADLAGTLEVNLLDGFMPTVGDEFIVLTAADGVLGAFVFYDLPALSDGNEWSVLYEPNEVILQVNAMTIPEPSSLLLAAFAALVLLPQARSISVRNHR